MTTVTGEDYQTLTVTVGDYKVVYPAAAYVSVMNETDGVLMASGSEEFAKALELPAQRGANNWEFGGDTLYLRAETAGKVLLVRTR